MKKVLISLEDRRLADVVKTAFKQFPGLAAFPVPPESLVDVLREGGYQAVVCDLHAGGAPANEFLAEIRETAPDVAILALVDQRQRERFNKVKMDFDIFSCLSLPLDPFELGRRILRLESHLNHKTSVRR